VHNLTIENSLLLPIDKINNISTSIIYLLLLTSITMFKRILLVALSTFALALVFLMDSTSTAQCTGVCSGTHTGNFDLSMKKTYVIEPICYGSAKVVTFTLSFMNSGSQTAT
jgi:hypothetical protein